MKNFSTLAMLMELAALSEQNTGIIKGKKPPANNETKSSLNIPFKEQGNIPKIIEDYNLIVEGKSKKGIRKQNLIKSKIHNWIEKGLLKETDLKPKK